MTASQIALCNRALVTVCGVYHVRPSDILGPSKQQRFVWPRWLCVRLILDSEPVDYRALAHFFGRHRSDVYRVTEAFKNRIQTEPSREREYRETKARFEAFTSDLPAPTT